MLDNYNVIDLFAGAGGLSLGAARAGFRVAAAVEIDRHAVATHAFNFPQSAHLSADVSLLSGAGLLSAAGIEPGHLHGLIGGPPCQGFSDIGKKSASDPRNLLLGHFFRLVRECSPSFFVAENVPGLLAERNSAVLKSAIENIPDNYVLLPPIKIRASDYGVPTTRTRIFLIGYDPLRCSDLQATDLSQPPEVEDIRIKDAFAGLPSIRATWQTEPASWRKVKKMSESRFSQLVTNAIPIGLGNRESLLRYTQDCQVSGFLGTEHTEDIIKRFASLRPGERDAISRAPRLANDGYCPTLRAGTGPEKGSFQAIRPVHPTSPRVICPREAARAQGFPDWFVFHPTKWHAFRQIGNSVSPMIAEFVLSKLFERLM